MAKLRVGLVGCGRISVVYEKAFSELKDIAELVCVMDIVPERSEKLAARTGARQVLTYDEMLEQDLDVIHLATPHHVHAEQAIAALEAGINVLTEKPMAISLADADRMIETADRTGRLLGVIFQNRYMDAAQRMKQLITDGELGQITGARSLLTWTRPDSYYRCPWKGKWDTEGGGVLIDQAIHSLDLVQWLVGSDVDWIHGHYDRRVRKTIEVEDIAEAIIRFKNGCMYSLYACNYYVTNEPIEIQIYGEKGKLTLIGSTLKVELEGKEREMMVPSSESNLPGKSYWGNNHQRQLRDYYTSLLEDKPLFIDGREGRKALAMVLGVYRSSREGGPVYL